MQDPTYDQRKSIKKIDKETDFVHNLITIYGEFKPGMKDVVLAKLKGMDRKDLVTLYNHILDNWGQEEGKNPKPPEWKRILIFSRDLGLSIPGARSKKDYHLVCQKCKRRRPLNAVMCPECGERMVFICQGKIEPGNLFYEGEIM